jgi:pimeloyl-ACP methyl ester carboxylesterase
MPAQPTEVAIPQPVLDDLAVRLAETRLSPDDATDWDAGASPAYMRELTDYWRDHFDWRAQEAALNRFAHFKTEVGGTPLHYIHERGTGPRPLPIVLTHGFPDSFVRFQKLIPLLADPAAHGGDEADAFDVVAPSLPGFGFSDASPKPDEIFAVGDLWHRLMTEVLGYPRYAAHGGDWGSTVTEQIGRSHSGSVVGIHLTDVPFWHGFQKRGDLSPEETEYFQAIQDFQMKEGPYALIQGTRPLTLANSLNDSPAGLAAWLVEKFRRWSDCGGDIETCFSKDELLTNVMVYWATQTAGSSFLPYHALMQAGLARWILEAAKAKLGSAATPAGFAMFPKDLSHPPKVWAERFFNVVRWTEMPRGGHFAAMEQPELLAEDIRAFFRPLRQVQ